ncbi:MAG: hypothetical protein GY710_24125 [Desulfobacteraceae bacterium]|nr:hypothetical protein [Desulfobacteraceae bacterium]
MAVCPKDGAKRQSPRKPDRTSGENERKALALPCRFLSKCPEIQIILAHTTRQLITVAALTRLPKWLAWDICVLLPINSVRFVFRKVSGQLTPSYNSD